MLLVHEDHRTSRLSIPALGKGEDKPVDNLLMWYGKLILNLISLGEIANGMVTTNHIHTNHPLVILNINDTHLVKKIPTNNIKIIGGVNVFYKKKE